MGKTVDFNGQKGHNRLPTHCTRTNHTIETCFLKYGFPPCYKWKGKPSTAPGTSTQANANANNTSHTSQQGSCITLFGFTQDKYHSILELLQQSKFASQTKTTNFITTSPFVMNSHSSNSNGKNSHLWILDTSVIDH